MDDREGPIDCPNDELPPGESMTCTQQGVAQACDYRNLATVNALALGGIPLSDDDPSHYFGAQDVSILVEKSTNGVDADVAPGPSILIGEPVTWTYRVTNSGQVALTDVTVTDDQGVAVSCPKETLAPGESMNCSAQGTALAGLYRNLGTATGRTSCQNVRNSDPSHYTGVGLWLEKATNGLDADQAPGPFIPFGDPVTWTYQVQNHSDQILSNVTVTDDQGVSVSCPKASLAPGELMTCSASGVADICEGVYRNVGTATANSPSGRRLTASDPSHYNSGAIPSIDIQKSTNGVDADVPTGPLIPVGSPVQWTYRVTNSGDTNLTEVSVSDDQGVAVSCPKATLEAGESMTCSASGSAQKGQYRNLGTVTAQSSCRSVSDSDPSHYFGEEPPPPVIWLEKSTNGFDADTAPGPMIPVGDPVTWTYQVLNHGPGPVFNISVTDDQGVSVSCPKTSLEEGQSMTCSGSGTAQPCQYRNLGKVTATTSDGTALMDTDPSHYFGKENPSIDIEKLTNGADADFPTGPEVTVGSIVNWTYLVTNTGDATLSQVTVTDDQGVAVSCPRSRLAPGESMTCSASGIAQEGQYSNLGTVTAQASCEMVQDSDPSHYFGRQQQQGCTPGYWKNHLDSWPPTGLAPAQSVQSVFSQASAYPAQGSASLTEALDFGGGGGVEGGVRNLLRAAVASLLNASHPGVGFPRSASQVISSVNAALASGDRDTMLSLASDLDRENNFGCPLN